MLNQERGDTYEKTGPATQLLFKKTDYLYAARGLGKKFKNTKLGKQVALLFTVERRNYSNKSLHYQQSVHSCDAQQAQTKAEIACAR